MSSTPAYLASARVNQWCSALRLLLIDIDVSILGAPEARFAEYERQIRDEYSFVPEALFRQKRGEILRAFLARPALYSTEHFRGLLEHRARANLARSLGESA